MTTRYNPPLPLNQAPNTQGRPAGPGQPAQAQQYEQPGWPQPNAPRTAGRPAAAGYGDPAGYPSGYPADPQTGGRPAGAHDPYAALRPDGYGYGQPPQTTADPYGLAGYTAPQPQSPQGYGNRAPQVPPPKPLSPYPQGADPYAHAPLPYGAPQTQGYGSPQQPQTPYGGGDQWGSQGLAADTRDYGYANPGAAPAQAQWGGDHYGEPQLEPIGGYHNDQHPQQGGFDQSYAEDDAQYEDGPRGGGWKKVVGLVACTLLVGGGLVIGYSSIMGSGDGKDTPLVKGASGPSKVKPSDPGGKQFAHADSKIMGRLGEGGSEEGSDAAGVRKVPVVTVGRDGTIQPPSAEEETRAVVSVPGLTVIDGLGAGPSPTRSAGPADHGTPPVQMVASSEGGPVSVGPPKKPAKVTAEDDFSGAMQTKETVTPKADPPPKKVKVAAATPADAPVATGPKPTGAGYVAVLASVPASNSSRIDALKQFADMQQKYSVILQNKTPDVQEANLGEKGTYHRLLVGPPGSRDSASSLCTQLKAQGYSGCWVTAY